MNRASETRGRCVKIIVFISSVILVFIFRVAQQYILQEYINGQGSYAERKIDRFQSKHNNMGFMYIDDLR